TGGGGGGTDDTCSPACSGDTPVCDEAEKECVGCLKEADCSGDKSHCNVATSTCVACLDTEQCTDAAASGCTAGECGKCSVNDDCKHITDKGICDEGACVECTVEDESACGMNSCNPATNTCTMTERGKVQVCEPCVADSECETDHLCVPLNYKGED